MCSWRETNFPMWLQVDLRGSEPNDSSSGESGPTAGMTTVSTDGTKTKNLLSENVTRNLFKCSKSELKKISLLFFLSLFLFLSWSVSVSSLETEITDYSEGRLNCIHSANPHTAIFFLSIKIYFEKTVMTPLTINALLLFQSVKSARRPITPGLHPAPPPPVSLKCQQQN